MANCSPSAHGPPYQRRAELVRPRLVLHDAGSRSQQCEVIGVGHHVKVGDRAVRYKMVKEGWGDDRTLWQPRLHLAGRRVMLLVETYGFPAAELCHKPSKQIVSESRVVDHLNEEAVRNHVKRPQDVHCYCYCSARGLTLVKTKRPP